MLGLGASVSTHSNYGGPWNPSRLPGLIYWFRFNHGIVLDAQGDITKWTNQVNAGASATTHAEQDGGSTTSPIVHTDGSIKFDAASNFLRFKDGGANTTLQLGAFSMYWRIKFDASETLNAEDLIEKDANNFFKIVSPTATRCKIGGNRHDFTHDEMVEGRMMIVGFERDAEGELYSFVDGSAGDADEGEGTEAVSTTLDLIQFGKPVHTSYWYEVVICSDSLNINNRILLNDYLGTLGR